MCELLKNQNGKENNFLPILVNLYVGYNEFFHWEFTNNSKYFIWFVGDVSNV